MEEYFVSYKLALGLKELNFDEPCLAMYSDQQLDMWLQDQYDFRSIDEESGFQFKNSMWNDTRFVAAPLYQQAFDWMEDQYNISVRFYGCIKHENLQFELIAYPNIEFLSKKYRSRSKMREECLLKMIGLCKSN